MSYINWNLANQGGFQNALAQGFQMGDMMRQRKEQAEAKKAQEAQRNALSSYVQNPNDETFGVLATQAPELAYREMGARRERQAKAEEAALVQAALGGDDDALTRLATVSFDTWKSLNSEQREAAAAEAQQYGNAALDVLNLPPGPQRSQAIIGYANRFGSPEIAEIANLPPQEQEQALRAAVAEAKMTEKLISMEQPDYMAIPAGGTLVDTRNPQAVQAFGQGSPIQITDEAGYNALQPGQQYIDPQGNVRVKGGSGGNAGGGFPQP